MEYSLISTEIGLRSVRTIPYYVTLRLLRLRIINSVPIWDYVPDLYAFAQVLPRGAYLRYAVEAYVLVFTDIDLQFTSCRLHFLRFGSGQTPPVGSIFSSTD